MQAADVHVDGNHVHLPPFYLYVIIIDQFFSFHEKL